MWLKENKEGLFLGNKQYIGECSREPFESLGRAKYDTKIMHFKDGKMLITKANQKVFRIPIPGLLPSRRFHTSPEEKVVDTSEYRMLREDNLHRARSRMYQIVLSNNWNWFTTLTFDDNKVEASNIPLVMKKLQGWLKNSVQRDNIGYLLVPEYHKKDNRVHVHTLIKGDLQLSFDDVYAVQGFRKPIKSSSIKKYGISPDRVRYPVYNVKNWLYGYSTAIPVYGSLQRLSNYCLKYMTKDTSKIFGRYYWCSKNIKLYPEYELCNTFDYYTTNAREYSCRGSDVCYKYINKLGDVLQDICDDEVVV